MPRSGPSTADQELLEAVSNAGLQVSPAQLERWRSAGLVPRNDHTGLGRGLGSSSSVPPEAVAATIAMAVHTRAGRSRHQAVLEWFLRASLGTHRGVVLPEPPIRPVRQALRHAEYRNVAAKVARQLTAVDADERLDQAFAAAEEIVQQIEVKDPQSGELMRLHLLEGLPIRPSRNRRRAARTALVQAVAISIAGAEETGYEALVDALRLSRPDTSFTALEGTDHRLRLAAELLAPPDRTRRCFDASPDALCSARDLARDLVGLGALTRIGRWDPDASVPADHLADAFTAHGFALFARPGSSQLRTASLVAAVPLFLDPEHTAAGRRLLAAIGESPREWAMTRLTARSSPPVTSPIRPVGNQRDAQHSPG
ncbi:hypothetical protein SAMN06264364_1049 [Quadrisphaera granulorum]|uniref:Uncharacterized protein n=1 Tax=Quadrisphaera granulorum TaxID=317664 RepID=A0A316ACW3_9ACTN|nr:hypothetical protein [Quadrisphaera granulorum]PWJ55088.1 hypothetical protein BXY45_1049 [Quadrisphaera granulorum]SZE95597.1 hypothetical protein SAMN06264364_1049 [Quadrisphaera granulorum]